MEKVSKEVYPGHSSLEQEVGEGGGARAAGAHGERHGVAAALHAEHYAQPVLLQSRHCCQLYWKKSLHLVKKWGSFIRLQAIQHHTVEIPPVYTKRFGNIFNVR